MYKRIAGVLAGVLFAVVMAGCGDSKSTPTAPATPPVAPAPAPAPQRTPANIQIMGSWECTDRFCDYADFELRLVNNGGADANLNFLRIENRRMEPVLELGANYFIETFGSNVLRAGGKLDIRGRAQLGFFGALSYRDYTGARIIRFELNPPR